VANTPAVLEVLTIAPPVSCRSVYLRDFSVPRRGCIHASERTVMELFQEQAVRWPDRPAPVGDGGRLTYAELDRATARVAHVLVAQGGDDR
jgi:non-ribosomal peptide synthetase component F